ncbi:RiPP maturation radical SAM C-methyltransferase [Nocardia brasiliensis]
MDRPELTLTSADPWHRTADRPARVALVNMPFAIADRPSIQCGLLKAVLTAAGHRVDVHYLNMRLSAQLGASAYHRLASPRRNNLLLGDWLFSSSAFDGIPEANAYLAGVPGVSEACTELEMEFDDLCELRSCTLPAFLDSCVDRFDWARYDIIGFTSTFEQHVAALAFARRLKQRHPQLTIVFGGANVDDEMGVETMRAFDWVDLVVVGEGEVPLAELVSRVKAGESPLGIPGVVGRHPDGSVSGSSRSRPVSDMDSLPDPDYDDYFSTLFEIGPSIVIEDPLPMLLVESSRGCWWGQKHHCTFCGLNTNGMRYRSKSPGAVMNQLARLSRRHSLLNFEAVDNIMDHSYIKELWSTLADERYDYRFFYEVKANLSREHVKIMAEAGISAIQPGIESLSTRILRLMRKGTTMLDNIRVLKWARHYEVKAGWNLLTGFPGERVEDYLEQAAVIPLLTHLWPPTGVGRVWLERFSPYFFDDTFPVRDRRPEPAYRFIYPQSRVDLDKIAYFFQYEMDDVVVPPKEIHEAVEKWRQAWHKQTPPSLVYQRAPDWLQLLDRRDVDNPAIAALHDAEAAAYEICVDWQRTPDHVVQRLAAAGYPGGTVPEVQTMLDRFCDAGVMLREGNRYLSLANPVRPR